MRKRDKDNEVEYDDGSYVVKKSKKANIFAFIACVLIAIIMWAYAEADQKQKVEELVDIVDSSVDEARQEAGSCS